jgi:hypothetical protein
MEQLGKEPADAQLSNFGITLAQARTTPSLPPNILEHFPEEVPEVKLLCLTKIKEDFFPDRYEQFTSKHMQTMQGKNISQGAKRLAKESLEFLSRPALDIKSIRTCVDQAAVLQHASPFHRLFLDGDYGNKNI